MTKVESLLSMCLCKLSKLQISAVAASLTSNTTNNNKRHTILNIDECTLNEAYECIDYVNPFRLCDSLYNDSHYIKIQKLFESKGCKLSMVTHGADLLVVVSAAKCKI